MNKQQLLQIAQRNILEKRNNAIDQCEQLLSKLRAWPEWAKMRNKLEASASGLRDERQTRR
ncbi:MAG: hypothetical protein IKA29_03215 [Clostridia bacterium]|nr:hypothetical protein [Clostridia bacterium]